MLFERIFWPVVYVWLMRRRREGSREGGRGQQCSVYGWKRWKSRVPHYMRLSVGAESGTGAVYSSGGYENWKCPLPNYSAFRGV